VLPHSEELMTLAARTFVLRFPAHPITALYSRSQIA